MILHFTARTINCVYHSIRSMFRVLGMYNFVVHTVQMQLPSSHETKPKVRREKPYMISESCCKVEIFSQNSCLKDFLRVLYFDKYTAFIVLIRVHLTY